MDEVDYNKLIWELQDEANNSDENNLKPKFYSPYTCLWVTAEQNTEQANKSKVKEVYQYDLEGNFIAKYSSQSEATRQTKISQGNIGQVLRGLRPNASGYIWSYKSVSMDIRK